MDNPSPTSVNPNSETDQNSQAWWSRPIWGEGSIIADLFSGGRSFVSEEAIMLHNREKMDAHFFAKTAEAIDSEKFSNQEFVLFIKIKYCLARGIEEYEGLTESVKLLQAAIEAKNSYLTLDQTEIRYRSSKQQEFYKFVEKSIANYEGKETFRTGVQEKLVEVLPSVKTEEGKVALQAYVKELNRLSEYELGLKLLSLFKAHQLADYSILRTISDMVGSFREKDTVDYKALLSLVIAKYEIFEKLRKIIGVSEQRSNPDTYARMLQYIALSYRHKAAYTKFQELLGVMRQWMKHYQAIVRIRQEHPAEQYRQPKDFQEVIPGETIYEKYKKSLTDKQTGHSYVDFGEGDS